MFRRRLVCAALGMAAAAWVAPSDAPARNLVLFVADGLRAAAVNETTAPTMAALRKQGVDFANSHSVFPSTTMANASAFATGHFPGDTGIYGNTLLAPTPIPINLRAQTLTPFIEYIPALRGMNAATGGNFINEETFLSAAHRAGYQTAAIGKLGPAALQALAHLDDSQTIIIDDATGRRNNEDVLLAVDIDSAIAAATGQPAQAPSRGPNGAGGNCERAGTLEANLAQQAWFTDVATKAVLPRFKANGKPFALVYWSRDPDGSQHGHGDSEGALIPGINGDTSMKAIRNADDNLRRIIEALRTLGLEDSTDVIVAADHGFSTIAKTSTTSPSVRVACGALSQALPQGFVAMDLGGVLKLPVSDPDNKNAEVTDKTISSRGNAVIGNDATAPEVIVTANGGNDLIYLPTAAAPRHIRTIVTFLLSQDYTGGVFVDDKFGAIDGALPMSALNLEGAALTARPAIILSFRTFSSGCDNPLRCGVEVADTGGRQGQGMHGTLSRSDTANFMAAMGPSFKTGFQDVSPASNADIGMTIASLLGLKIDHRGRLTGRVLIEALKGGAAVTSRSQVLRAKPTADGLATVLKYQTVGEVRYFDAGGIPERTLGLESERKASK